MKYGLGDCVMDVGKAILVLAAAVVFHALTGRYESAGTSFLRLDRLTGSVAKCSVGEAPDYAIHCDAAFR